MFDDAMRDICSERVQQGDEWKLNRIRAVRTEELRKLLILARVRGLLGRGVCLRDGIDFCQMHALHTEVVVVHHFR
jgi:hypothetical protein